MSELRHYTAVEIRRGVEEGLRFALPYELHRASNQAAELTQRQVAVSDDISDAMKQSSETWHDNAPADALFAEMYRLDTQKHGLVSARRYLREVAYPEPEMPEVTIGSRVMLAMQGDEWYMDIVGNLPLTGNEEDHGEVERGSVAAPTPQALLGALANTEVTVELPGRNLVLAVVSIDQMAQRLAYDPNPQK